MAPRVLHEKDWATLREMRLAALRESPRAFLSAYEEELYHREREWRAEFARGEWIVEVRDGTAIALVGVTRNEAMPPGECYLEYLWVSPAYRRRGVATELVKNVVRRLADAGFTRISLWVLDGNEAARRLYEKCGFASTSMVQRPDQDPSRREELMRLDLPPQT